MNGVSLSPVRSVGTAGHLTCLPGRATEDWTPPAVLILQVNSGVFVSYIKRTMYLK